MTDTRGLLRQVAAMREALNDKQAAEMKMAQAARMAGIDIMPSPHLRAGRPMLLVSPDLYQKLVQSEEATDGEEG